LMLFKGVINMIDERGLKLAKALEDSEAGTVKLRRVRV
jgi:hypothetical protein